MERGHGVEAARRCGLKELESFKRRVNIQTHGKNLFAKAWKLNWD